MAALPLVVVGLVAWLLAAATGPGALIVAVPVSVALITVAFHPRGVLVPQQGDMPVLPDVGGTVPSRSGPCMVPRPGAAWPAALINGGYAVGLLWFTGLEWAIISPDVLPGPVVAGAAVVVLLGHAAIAFASPHLLDAVARRA